MDQVMTAAREDAVTEALEDAKTLEALLNEANGMRLTAAHLSAELDGIKKAERELKNKILAKMDELGVTMTATDRAKASISTEELPQVDKDHWEEVWKFIFENGYTEIMRKQLNATSFRELKALGVEIPFVTTHVERKLNLRSV